MAPIDRDERSSRMAAWSAGLASLSVPVLVITAIGHRSRLLDVTSTYASMAAGFTLAGLAVIIAIAAFANIWQDGRRGTGQAIRGLVVGLMVLSFPAYAAWQLVSEPQLTDISTALEEPPRFRRAFFDRRSGEARHRNPGRVEIALQRKAHPDLVSRFYPVGTPRVFQEAGRIVGNRGWQVLAERAPDETNETGRIEAVATTLIFGFRQDVVIRIAPEGEGALVDMRSAARNGAHDLGVNARRIRSFFGALDGALQGVTS